MTGRYEARNDELTTQIADLTKRLSRVEALLLNQTGPGYTTVTSTDFVTPPVNTAAGTFQVGYYFFPNGLSQGIEAKFRVVTPAAVTMEMRIVNDVSGVVISPTVTIPANSNTYQGIRARSETGLNIFTARLEFRVASGAGTVRVGLVQIVGGNFQQGTF